MSTTVIMILLVAVCFFAAVLNLAVESRFRQRLTRFALLAAIGIGIFFYGYGYASCCGIGFTSVIRALMALCRMFAGINDLGSIQTAPLFRSRAALSVFWLGHFLAFYVMASTAIAALGEKLLRRIRITLLRKGPLLLIYGVNPHSVAYGRRMAREKHRSVLFVDQEYNPVFDGVVQTYGAIIDKDSDALGANRRFLRTINMKPGNRKLELAALNEDGKKNLDYARRLLESASEAGIRPEQISLTAAGIGDEAAKLQALGGTGYSRVYAFDDYEMTARLMIREHPPCDLIRFDENGRALDDFHAVILGFGRMGRAVLSRLVISGQFYGSRFRVDVFDPGAQNGFLHDHPVLRNYDVRFHDADGTSDGFYSFLQENKPHIRMIVVCTGNREKNHEIAGDLAAWQPWDENPPLILHVTKESYFCLNGDRSESESLHFLEKEGLDPEEIDAAAMEVNQIHCTGPDAGRTAEENWSRCSFEDRQSCRAFADFCPALLRAAGTTADRARAGDWPPREELLENLSITEHLRWCAYQHVNGYSVMPEKTWEQRAKIYREGAPDGFRIGRDPGKRQHACLIPWEELDGLSAKENAVTGGATDYRQMDRNNVLIIPKVLKPLE